MLQENSAATMRQGDAARAAEAHDEAPRNEGHRGGLVVLGKVRSWWAPALIVYLGLAVFFTHDVLVSPGVITGGDWTVPATARQMGRQAADGLFLWTNFENLFGVSQVYLPLPLVFINGTAALLGLDGAALSKSILVGTLLAAGFSVHAYARRLGLQPEAAYVSGVFFMTSAVVFDYSAMGWAYVLLCFALLPWCLSWFDELIDRPTGLGVLRLGLVFALAVALASQALVWYPIAFGLLAVTRLKDRRSARNALAVGGAVVAVMLLANLSWILPFVLAPDPLLVAPASSTDVPLGQRLNYINLLRSWGSLFNYQFETAFPDSLAVVTFAPPFIAFAGALHARRRETVFLGLIALVPFVVYGGASFFYNLPLTMVVRDVSRFILFSAMGTALLIGVFVDAMLTRHAPLVLGRLGFIDALIRRPTPFFTGLLEMHVPGRHVAAIGAGLLLLNSIPFWTGELTGGQETSYDIRLRTLQFPAEYSLVEFTLSRENTSAKAIYLPLGGFVSVQGNPRYEGAFKEASDVYAHFSPVPGSIYEGDRRPGEYREVAGVLLSSTFASADLDRSEALGLLGVKHIVVRKDLRRGPNAPDAMLAAIEKDADVRPSLVSSNVVLLDNTAALPHVYATRYVVPVNGTPAASFANATLLNVSRDGGVIVFSSQVPNATSAALPTGTNDSRAAKITFQKVNPSRYDVQIEHATQPFVLVLLESYDDRWTVHALPPRSDWGASTKYADREVVEARVHEDFVLEDAIAPPISKAVEAHFVANGFGNGWLIDPPLDGAPLTVSIRFAPQSFVYMGAVVFCVLLLAFAVATFFGRRPIARARGA